ncbi:MAG: DUF3987 domain-containing protein [Planctomycetaceae bacterium]
MNADGWRSCHAIDRADQNPSASFNVHTGSYKDHAGDNLGLTFFDLCSALDSSRFPTWKAAKDHFKSIAFPESREVVNKLAQRPTAKGLPKPAGKPGATSKSAKTCATVDEAIAAYERKLGPVGRRWEYVGREVDDDGHHETILVVCRWDSRDGKTIRPVSKHPGGWRCEALPKPWPLYGLPSLIDDEGPPADQLIVVVEGEKCADELLSYGAFATTSPGGSSNAKSADWTPLTGRDVAILADNDAVGRKYAGDVAAILRSLECRVKIVEIPDLPKGGDVVDFIRRKDDPQDSRVADEARSEQYGRLLKFIKVTPWEYDESRDEIQPNVDIDEPIDDDPTPPEPRTTWQPFPVSCLPMVVGRYVESAAAAIGCDPSLVAVPLMSCLARAIGNRRVARVKLDWKEPAILWTAIVGKSGSHKTPAFNAATRFLVRRQKCAFKEWTEAKQQYETDLVTYERELAVWKRSKSTDLPPEKSDPPACNTVMTSDCTIEGLIDRLSDQYDGTIVVRDELSGWINGIGEYKGGKGSDIGHWLAVWTAGAIKVDRKGVSGSKQILYVPMASVGITGGIQPEILRSAIGREHRQDGLCQRLLFAYPPPRKVVWSEATVSPSVEQDLANIFDQLFGLEPTTDFDGDRCPVEVDFTPEAKSLWVERFNSHRAEQQDLDDDLAAVWSKLEAYTARIALIFAMCDGFDEIDQSSLSNAITVINFFKNEARRVYTLFGETDDDRQQRELIELVERRGGRITVRDLAQTCRLYREPGVADEALTELIKSGLGRWQVVPTAGRPRTEFVLSTSITLPTEAEALETQRRWPSVTASISESTEIDDEEVIF